jgi:beta-glucosidase
MFSITTENLFNNTWFSDPMIFGHYPDDGLQVFGDKLPDIKDGDMETICQPLDFYGVNVYVGQKIKAEPDGSVAVIFDTEGPAFTAMDWPVMPEVLYWGPRFLAERYNLPIVVTESGMANLDWIHRDGKVHDPQRIDYLSRYLSEFKRAIGEGVDGRGYFLWSIMDNFEWDHGFKSRFGIIYTDYTNGSRTLKDSAYWYRDVIASNGKDL